MILFFDTETTGLPDRYTPLNSDRQPHCVQLAALLTEDDGTERASLNLPDYTPHALRHTWASWHYCVHRDIIKLQTEGDWSDIKTVLIYAKLMPEAYKEQIEEWWRIGPAVGNCP